MKAGDYIRTLDGIIFKIKEIKDIDVYYSCNPPELKWQKQTFCILEDKNEAQPISQVKKSSPNIIDLIEVGDYLNGWRVNNIEKNSDGGGTIIKIGNTTFNVLNNEEIYTPVHETDSYYQRIEKLKTIVTHEQFESMSYKVGD